MRGPIKLTEKEADVLAALIAGFTIHGLLETGVENAYPIIEHDSAALIESKLADVVVGFRELARTLSGGQSEMDKILAKLREVLDSVPEV